MAHAGVLAALHADCFPSPWSEGEMIRLLAMPGAFALLALVGDAPCAFVLGRVAADEAEIIAVGTHPGTRRRGLATWLIDAAGAHAARRGARTLFLEVAADNAPARRLYATFGCVQVGYRPDYYQRGNSRRADALILGKNLVETKESARALEGTLVPDT